MHVFTYGTLMPGHVRWPLIADLVDAVAPDRVQGLLYDTHHGYPAAVLGPGGCIRGWLLTSRAGGETRLLGLLDEIEAVGVLYERVHVTTESGVSATTYGWLGGLADLDRIEDGAWSLHHYT